MYLLIVEVRYNISIYCHGNCIEVNKFNYMLETDILRKLLGVLRGDFLGFGCLNDAKMPC